MGLIFLEAFGAGVLLVLIVWWTMFSGRVKGELPAAPDPTQRTSALADAKSRPAHEGKTE